MVADAQQVERILREVDVAESAPPAAGGEASLRGVPVVGRGVAGAIRGTSPHGELVAKKQRRRR
jgi:hypothetical protein